MQALLEAVKARCEAHLPASTRVFLEEAPDSATIDYVVMRDSLAGMPDYTNGDDYTEEREIQFHVWGTRSTAVRQLLDALPAWFKAAMPLDVGSVMYARKSGTDTLEVDPNREPDGQVWHGIVSMQFQVQR